MSTEYKKWPREDKLKYSKQFTSSERKSYRKGKKNGFMQGIFADSEKRKKYSSGKIIDGGKGSFIANSYSKKQLNELFDDIDKVKVVKK